MSPKLLAEFLGTAGLLIVVVGSGIMGETLAQGNDAIALLAIHLLLVLVFTLSFKLLDPFPVHNLILE